MENWGTNLEWVWWGVEGILDCPHPALEEVGGFRDLEGMGGFGEVLGGGSGGYTYFGVC